ncbi:MAG: hypothetical protein A2231_08245 [Candidatus Firestonebacteria bacterium RIFOXYA2_FULL_40_8]|nr:MAG: hypothetical protein A2231_08245 [Candidatus Firestonebacteria bacterium RIFOXYA2_FULL_40_8]
MAEGKNGSIWFYIVILIVGAVIGSVIGGLIGQIGPKEGWVHDILVQGVNMGLEPAKMGLDFFTLTFGFTFKLTLSSVLGIVIAGLILKKV